MATITYAHIVGATVYHVGELGVRRGIVKTISVLLRPGVETIKYNVALADSRDGIIDALEPTLFADVDLALANYKTTQVIV